MERSNNNSSRSRPINTKVRLLQTMLELRKLVIEGHSYSEIQEVLGLSKRTFYRYLAQAFQEDKKALEAQNAQQVMFHLTLLENRYNSILQQLNSIATDKNQSAPDRMAALHAAASLALTICKLHRDSPIVSIIEARRLKAIKEGAASPFLYQRDDSLFLPSIYRGGLRHLPPLASSSTQPPQPEEEEENGDGDGDRNNEEEEQQERRPRDHW